MATQAYNTGPVHFYVGLPSTTTFAVAGGGGINFATLSFTSWLYLGTAQRSPKRVTRRFHEEVWNDVSGTKAPFDNIYEGMEGLVAPDLTKWDWSVYRQMSALAGAVSGPGGTDDRFARGTLRMTEGKFVGLALVFPFYAKLAMKNQGMPPGYFYPCCWLVDDDELSAGTGMNVENIVFHCHSAFSPATGSFTLFTEVLPTQVPLFPPS